MDFSSLLSLLLRRKISMMPNTIEPPKSNLENDTRQGLGVATAQTYHSTTPIPISA